MSTSNISATLQSASPPPKTAAEIDLQTEEVALPAKLCDLPPLNAVATQVLALTADPDVDLVHLAKTIEADPAFAADILFLANSSLFGFSSRMYVLRHAIAVLGLNRIKALALTVAMRSFVGIRNPLIHQCWQHSVACAMVCEELSPIFGFSADRAYTAGIMHDIGRLGLLKAYPKEMTPILSAEHLDTLEVLRAEREELNVDHGRAGSWLLKSWAFPMDFSDVSAYHHDAPNENDSEIVRLVKVACGVADIIGFSAVRCRVHPSYLTVTSALPLRVGRDVVPLAEDLCANINARLAVFVG